jgi:uncharacterized protein (DUF1499 family)
MSISLIFSAGGFALALLCGAAAMLAGLGSRWEWWHFRTGFQILSWAAYSGLGAALVSLLGFIAALSSRQYHRVVPALIGIGLGLVIAWFPWQLKQTAQRVPAIHDITTDTANPPAFVAILPLRKQAPNPADYGGPAIAAQQQSAYPDLGPLIVKASPRETFSKALTTARDMGWQIVESNPDQGRIEATDTTFWFGFKDDVVVRVTPSGEGSRIDVRSVSRVGRSDIGTNARRIRAYLARIKERDQASSP